METEVKLAFKSKDELLSIINADWFADYCLDTSEKEPLKITNTYFDTPNRDFVKKGGSIRVRRYLSSEGERYEHTIKYGGGVVNGLHQRYEWNIDSESDEFDINEFKKKSHDQDDPSDLLNEILEGIDIENIVPLCSMSMERIKYMFGCGDSMMEACFDYGTIEFGDKKELICELEIELESGDVVDLQDLAQFIVDNTSGVPFNESKFRRVLKLLDSSKS